jgi:hypothetical protein
VTADLDLRAVDEATDRTHRDDGWLGEPDNGWDESAWREEERYGWENGT